MDNTNASFISQLEALLTTLKQGAAVNAAAPPTAPTEPTAPTITEPPEDTTAMRSQFEAMQAELADIKAELAKFSDKDLSGVKVDSPTADTPAPTSPTPPVVVNSPAPSTETFTPMQAANFLKTYGGG